MNRHDRAEAIVLAAEHHAKFLALELGARRVQRRLRFARSLGVVGAIFFGHLQEHPRLVELVAKHLVTAELGANLLLLLEGGLRSFLPVPEVRLCGLFD
jgi:hypothetical protein